MIEHINNIAQNWWLWMWPMLWQVSVVVGVVWVVDLLLRRRVWPQVRYALWLLVLLKLMMPPSLSLPTSLTSELGPLAQEAVSFQLPTYESVTQETTSEVTAPVVDLTIEEPFIVEAPMYAIPQIGSESETAEDSDITSVDYAVMAGSAKLSFKAYLMFIWLFGVSVLAAWLMLRFRQLRQISKRNAGAHQVPKWFDQVLAETAKTLKLRRLPEVVLSRDVVSPAVFGVFSPVLLMPSQNMATLSRKDAEHMLLHELSHIKRGDLKVHAFYMMLQILYWFNPLLWIVRRQLQHLRELCCDATVAWILREKTSGYRETILETARRLLAKPVEPGMGLLGLFEDSSRLKIRLKWLEKKTWKYRGLRVVTIFLLVAIMSACVLPMAARKTEKVKSEAELRAEFVEQMPLPQLTAEPSYRSGESIIIRCTSFNSQWQPSSNDDLAEDAENWTWYMRINGTNYRCTHGIPLFSGGGFPFKLTDCLDPQKSFPPGEYSVAYVYKNVDVICPDFPDRPVHFDEIVTNEVEFEVIDDEAVVASEFTATLPNGVTVELVGICDHPSEGKQWWRPDGTPLDQVPYEKIEQSYLKRVFSGQPSNDLRREFAFRLTHIGETEIKTRKRILRSNICILGRKVVIDDTPVENLKAIVASIPIGDNTVRVDIGVAAGAWQTVAKGLPDGDNSFTTLHGQGRFYDIREHNGNTSIKLEDSFADFDYRVVAIDNYGETHASDRPFIMCGIRKTRVTWIVFRDISLKAVKEFQFQTRPHEWITFKNVSLRPDGKTDVEIEMGEATSDVPDTTEHASSGDGVRPVQDEAEKAAVSIAAMSEGFYSFGEGEIYSKRLGLLLSGANNYLDQVSTGYDNKDWNEVSKGAIQVQDIFRGLKKAIEVDEALAWESFTKRSEGKETDAKEDELVDLACMKRTLEIFATIYVIKDNTRDEAYSAETYKSLCSSIINIAETADMIQRALQKRDLTMVPSHIEKLKADWSTLIKIESIKEIVHSASHIKTKSVVEVEGERVKVNSIGMKLVYIPAGEFMMGSGNDRTDDKPIHNVRISQGFYMGQTEVTQSQYKAVMGTNPSCFKGDSNPVEKVSWNDATEFCKKLSEREDLTYTLPTEAQWEYACRAGSTTAYCFGSNSSQLSDYANYDDTPVYGDKKTAPVGSFKPNAFGLYDMHGNVREWCRDYYAKDFYGKAGDVDPENTRSSSTRVLRGGSWGTSAPYCRSAFRDMDDPDSPIHSYNYGFRVVCSVSSQNLKTDVEVEVKADEQVTDSNVAIENVLASLKTKLIEMSSTYPELVGTKDIHIRGALEGMSLYGLDYLHNCKYWGKRGYEDTGSHSAHIKFKITRRPEEGNGFDFPIQAPLITWPNLNLVGWTRVYTGKDASPGFDAKVREVLQQHVKLIDELDQGAKTIGHSDVPDVQVGGMEKESTKMLRWADKETGLKLFNIDDIVRFDWEKQIFELTRLAAMDLMSYYPRDYRDYTVSDGHGIIYSGVVVPDPPDGISFDKPTIAVGGVLAPPLFKIMGNYPFDEDSDRVRFYRRLKTALSDAGVLEGININDPPTPITVLSEWVVSKENLRIKAKVFPETFRISEKARIVICADKDVSFEGDPDIVEINVVLEANGGKFGCSSLHEVPLKQLLADGVYTIEYEPWGPIRGSIDTYAKAGAAEVSVNVVTRKKHRKGPNTASYSKAIENFERCEPINITILPKVQPDVGIEDERTEDVKSLIDDHQGMEATELVPLKINMPHMGHIDMIDHSRIPNMESCKPRPPFMVPRGTTNVALNKGVTSSSQQPIFGNLSMITNGIKVGSGNDLDIVELGLGLQHVTIDLGPQYNLHAILIWHTNMMYPVYYDVIVQVANDPEFKKGVVTLFNNDHDNSAGMGVGKDKNYIEMPEGKLIDANGNKARYVRLYSNGTSQNELNRYLEVEVYGTTIDAKAERLLPGSRNSGSNSSVTGDVEIIEMNRIRLPKDTPILDQRKLDDREFLVNLLGLLREQDSSSGKGQATVQLQDVGEEDDSIYTVEFFHKGKMSRTDRYKVDDNNVMKRYRSWIKGKKACFVYDRFATTIRSKLPARFFYKVGCDFSLLALNSIGDLQLDVFIERILVGGAKVSIDHSGGMLRIITSSQGDYNFTRTVLLDPSKGYKLVSMVKRKDYGEGSDRNYKEIYQIEWKKYGDCWYPKNAELECYSTKNVNNAQLLRSSKVAIQEYIPDLEISDRVFSLEGLDLPLGHRIRDTILDVTYSYDIVSQKHEVDGLSGQVIRFPDEPIRKRAFLVAETDDIKWWWGTHHEDDIIGEARGDMVVPAGVKAELSVRYGNALSLLEGLGPNDLHTLTTRKGATLDEGTLRSIHSLTGLKRLVLMGSKLGAAELEIIKQFKHIERLCIIQSDLSDEDVEKISEMRWLKGLRIYSEEITNKSLEYVSRISGLDELFIAGGILTDEGFEHITKMPVLIELQLSKARDGMTVDVLNYLSNIPSLKKLNLGGFSVGRKGAEYISRIKGLESFKLNGMMRDNELAPLRQLKSLKELTFHCRFQHHPKELTDTGLRRLSEIESLESLELYYGQFTGKGLEYLSQLRNLKRLIVPNAQLLTENGLTPLSHLEKLEDLHLNGINLNDEDIAEIAKIKNLKSLSFLNGLDKRTDKSLTSIGELKGLSRLSVWGDFTDDGLVHLEGLKSLRSFKIQTKRGLSRAAIERLETALPNLKKVDCAKIIEDTPKEPAVEIGVGFGRVEGQVFIGKKVGAGETIWLHPYQVDVNDGSVEHGKALKTVADSSGRYIFEKVPQGWADVGRLIQTSAPAVPGRIYDPSYSNTSRRQIEVIADETVNITIGGTGRVVVGRFTLPPSHYKTIDLSYGIRSLVSALDRKDVNRLFSPEFRQFAFAINHNGKFQIEDVPPGEYELYVSIENPPFNGGLRDIAHYQSEVTVPIAPSGQGDDPFDLGTLELKLFGEPEYWKFHGGLEFDKKISLGFGSVTKESPEAVRCESIEFKKIDGEIEATVLVWISSWPKKSWQAGVVLLDAKDSPMHQVVTTVFQSSDKMISKMWTGQKELKFKLGKQEDLAEAVAFDIRIRQLTDVSDPNKSAEIGAETEVEVTDVDTSSYGGEVVKRSRQTVVEKG